MIDRASRRAPGAAVLATALLACGAPATPPSSPAPTVVVPKVAEESPLCKAATKVVAFVERDGGALHEKLERHVPIEPDEARELIAELASGSTANALVGALLDQGLPADRARALVEAPPAVDRGCVAKVGDAKLAFAKDVEELERPSAAAKDVVSKVSFRHDLKAAMKEAAADHRDMVVVFCADFAAPCVQLKRDASEPEVTSALATTIPVWIDMTDEEGPGVKVAKRIKVKTLPSIVILDEHGKEKRRLDGYRGAGELAGFVRAR